MKFFSALLSLLLFAPAAQAQSGSPNPIGGEPASAAAPGGHRPESFGPDSQVYTLAANTMAPLISDTTYTYVGGGLSRYRTGGNIWFQGAVTLPSGALLTAIEVDGCDTSATENVAAFLHRCPTGGGNCSTIGSIDSGPSATPGCTFFFGAIPNVTIDQLGNSYSITVALTAADSTTRFQAVRLFWHHQVSPAPGSATFSDVRTGHPLFRFVEALSDSGITAGCGGGNYCPDQPLTRGQMAVFLSVALGLHFPN